MKSHQNRRFSTQLRMRLTLSNASGPLLKKNLHLLASFLVVYLLWGTSYLAIKQALDSFAPLLLNGLRSLVAGLVLLGIVSVRGVSLPDGRDWREAGIVGILIIAMGGGLLSIGMQTVPTGTVSVLYATMPIFVSCMTAMRGQGISRMEVVGTMIGVIGVYMLTGSTLPGHQMGNWIVLSGAFFAAMGAFYAGRARMPQNMLVSSGIQLVVGGGCITVIAFASGEQMAIPSSSALMAFVFLILSSSMAGMIALNYLIANVGPAVATSYAYVNPLVALVLGTLFLGESLTLRMMLAIVIVLAGVIIVLYSSAGKRVPVATEHFR